MTTTITDLLCNNFGGIRRKNARFDSEKITCDDCQNIELFDTKINSGVGIRTSKGNTDTGFTMLETEEVIGIFESVQRGVRYFFVYIEDANNGTLYRYDMSSGIRIPVKYPLTKTGKCCGTDFVDGSEEDSDNFVFSNGVDILRVHVGGNPEVVDITGQGKVDADGHTLFGLGCKVYDSRLWLFHDNKVLYSHVADCDDFHSHDITDSTSAGIIEFTKNVTAIVPYLGSLAVFFSDSSCLITGQSNYSVSEESPGGCASYDSLVFHGTQLWFYDDTKKGVFSFQQVVNGDKTLGENVAIDIQEELMSIDETKLDKIKALSVVLKDRNEIWFILPTHFTQHSTIMIFDYSHGEWVKRVCPPINCFNVVGGILYSGGKKLYREYDGDTFSGEYIESMYTCSVINFGIDNALKIFYFPPRVTLDMIGYANKFYVKYIRNYDYTKNKKEKYINAKGLKKVLHYDVGEKYDQGYVYPPNKYSSIAKFPSATFKTLEIQIYTKQQGEEFAINNFECNKVKIKQI